MRVYLEVLSSLRVCQKDASLNEVWDKEFSITNSNAFVRVGKNLTDIFFNKVGNGGELLHTNYFGSGFTDILVGMGDGISTNFSKNITAFAPIDVDTVVLRWTQNGAKSAMADSTGIISGSGLSSASVTQDGTVTIEFSTAPEDGTPITLDFSRGTSEILSLYFDLSTQENPSLDIEQDFQNKLNLDYSEVSLDWYENSTYNIYLSSMSTIYSGVETQPITGVGIYAKTYDIPNSIVRNRLILKSTYPAQENELFPDGLILNEGSIGQCTITSKLEIKISK